MTFPVGGFVLMAVAGLLLPAPAVAQRDAACEGFRVVAPGEGRIVSYHQASPDGPGPGDIRPGVRTLVDNDDNEIGTLRWYETLIAPHGDLAGDSVTALRYYWILPDGMVLGEGLNLAGAARSDTGKPPIESDTLVIVGGTGAYAGARGTVEQLVGVDDDDPLAVAFEVNFVC